MSNRLYKLEHYPELGVVRFIPTAHLARLSVEQAVTELKACLKDLHDELKANEQAFMADELEVEEALEKMRRLITEIELAEQCIAYLRDNGDFRPWATTCLQRLRPAA